MASSPNTTRDIPDDAEIEVWTTVVWLRTDEGGIAAFRGATDELRIRNFGRTEVDILDCLSKGTTKAQIKNALAVDDAYLNVFLADLAQWAPGSLRWQILDSGVASQRHRQLSEATRLRDIWLAMSTDSDNNRIFHRDGLNDGNRQFDSVEATISHVFRESHEALDGRSYGQAFCDWLLETGRLKANFRILEAGCGLGIFACAILDRLAEVDGELYQSLQYTMFDLSTELQKAQRSNCSKHSGKINFVHGDIESHDFAGEKFDLVISNEVIADLRVEAVSLENIESGNPRTNAEKKVLDYGLDCAPVALGKQRKALLNYGAIKFLEMLERCIDGGGNAVIVEYGTLAAPPKAVRFDNHLEFTIQFGHLLQVSENLGFRAELKTLGDVLAFQGGCNILETNAFHTLSGGLLPAINKEALPTLAYTPQMLDNALGELAGQIGNLRFLRLDDPKSFTPFRFEMLLLDQRVS